MQCAVCIMLPHYFKYIPTQIYHGLRLPFILKKTKNIPRFKIRNQSNSRAK